MDRQVKGILGTKLGMTQVWSNNQIIPVTVVQAGPCVVTQVRTPDKDGYQAVQLAYGAVDPRRVNRPRPPLRSHGSGSFSLPAMSGAIRSGRLAEERFSVF